MQVRGGGQFPTKGNWRFRCRNVTIDDIIAHCEFPESATARLTETHRVIAANRLAYYKDPIEGNIPSTRGDRAGWPCLNAA